MKKGLIEILLFWICFSCLSLYGQRGGEVVISEVYFDSHFVENMGYQNHHAGEFIELFNSSNTDIDISGWHLVDNIGTYTIPRGTIIKAGGFKVITPSSIDMFIKLFPEAAGHESDIIVQDIIYLNNNVEKVVLTDRKGKTQFNMSYFPVGWTHNNSLLKKLNSLKTQYNIDFVYGFKNLDNNESFNSSEISNFYRNGIALNNKEAFYGGDYRFLIAKSIVRPFHIPFQVPLLDPVKDFEEVILSNQNYIHTIKYTKPALENELDNIDTDSKIETITYFNRLGKPIQKREIKASPNKNDIITHFEYDSRNRISKEFLPVESYETRGSYQNINVNRDINSYYLEQYPQDFIGVSIENNVNAYSQTIYEPSPLNRVVKSAAPGAVWKVKDNYDKTVKFDWKTNSSTEIPYFKVKYLNNNTELSSLYKDGFYAENELFVTTIKDENWSPVQEYSLDHTRDEYIDKLGRLILKRTYNENISHDTFYVYDDFDNLSYIISPKVDITDGVNQIELDELCYQYRYDNRNRLIEKKIPGKGWEYTIYNNLDLPVMTQDANLRDNDQWLFTKYDVFGRVAYTGIISDSRSPSLIRAEISSFENNLWVNRTNASVIGGVTIYYTNDGYPNALNAEIYTINYYDNYNLGSIVAFNPANGSGTWEGMTASAEVKGLVTVNQVKVLNTNDWITTATYYDEHGRAWETHIKNEYLNTEDWELNKLDFLGKVIKTKTIHTKDNNPSIITIDYISYDHIGRFIEHTQKINGQEQKISKNQYNEVGQLVSKTIGDGLQEIDYSFNIRGWLTGINNDQKRDNDLFDYSISYNNPIHGAKPLYNGNISETSWKTTNDYLQKHYLYDYDGLGRLTSAKSSSGNYDLNQVTYDKIGNIMTLNRNGHTNASATSFGVMDDLVYNYYQGGSFLVKVTDNGNTSYGFKDGTNTNWDFGRDNNGNTIRDLNKGVSDIQYNYLNLPEQIDISNSEGAGSITYVYDAVGTKQKKIVYAGGSLINTEYSGNYIYQNGNLKFMHQAEGYVEPENDGSYTYVYQYKDHLDNVRMSFANPEGTYELLADDTFDEGNEGWSGNRINENGRLKVTVQNKYSGSAKRFTGDFEQGTKIQVKLNMDKYNTTVPVRVLLNERDANNNSLGWYFFGYAENGAFEGSRLIKNTNVNAIYVKLDITSVLPSATQFYMDDVTITKGEIEIREEKNYYPFGLEHKGYNNTIVGVPHRYSFNNKEFEQNISLNTYDLGARQYDPAIGRFMVLDPMSDFINNYSPFALSYDNPIRFIDEYGLGPCNECTFFGKIFRAIGSIFRKNDNRDPQNSIAAGNTKRNQSRATGWKRDRNTKRKNSTSKPSTTPDSQETEEQDAFAIAGFTPVSIQIAPTILPQASLPKIQTPNPKRFKPSITLGGRERPIEAGSFISVPTFIQFTGDGTDLDIDAMTRRTLNAIIQTLTDYPQLRLEIYVNYTGVNALRTDPTFEPRARSQSNIRGQKIIQFLRRRGVAPNRVKARQGSIIFEKRRQGNTRRNTQNFKIINN